MCNSIWEAKGTLDPRKPRPHDLHSVREKFIKAKYLLKSFISSEEGSSTSVAKRSGVVSVKCSPDESLRAACRVDDIAAALEAIAHGADVCSSTKKNSSVLYPPLPPSVPPSSSSFIQSSHRKGSISDDPACTNILSLPHIPPIIIDSRSANTSTGGDAIREDGEGMIKKPSCSPLHLSILCGSTACAVLLVMNGADPRSSSEDDDVADSASSVGCDSEKYNNVTPSTINCIDGGTLAHKLPSLPLTEVAENAGHVLLAAYLRRKLDKIQTGQSSLKEVRTDATAVATTFSPVPIPTCEMSSSTHLAAPSTSFRTTASEACVATDITVTRDDSISQVITADINNGKDVTILPNKTQESSFPSVSTSAIEKENGSKTAILSAQVFGLHEVPPKVTEGSEEITAVDLRDRSRGEREDGKLLEGVEEDEDDERGDDGDADEDEDEDEDDDLEDFYAALMRDESLPKVD